MQSISNGALFELKRTFAVIPTKNMDVFNIEAAVKALQPLADQIEAAIEGAIDRVGATTITIGPIPKFTITVEMPTSVAERLNPNPDKP